MSGLLAPTLRETMLGNAIILEVFNVSKVGKVAGCRVTDGTVERGANVRLIRDNVVIHEGKLSQLKRFKDDAREVTAGQECGMAFEGYQDMRAGDVIECYRVEQIQRSALSPHTQAGADTTPESLERERFADRRLRPPDAALTRRNHRTPRCDHHRDSGRDPASVAEPARIARRRGDPSCDRRHPVARRGARSSAIQGHAHHGTEVRMSPDLKLATIYVMPLGGRDVQAGGRRASERNKRYLRGEIAHRVNLKFAPDIRFRIDERFAEAERIEKLLSIPCACSATSKGGDDE